MKGTLLCGNRPASGVEVKIFDEDDGPDLDDLLGWSIFPINIVKRNSDIYSIIS